MPRTSLRPPILGGFTGLFKAELRHEPTDLVKPAEVGIVTHGFKAEIPHQSNGAIMAARIAHRYRLIQIGITPGTHGFD